MAFKNFALLASAVLSFTTPALAHMQLAYPFPINSQQDPQTPDNLKDYSYTSPLAADGSNYPCKGYQNQRPIRTTASFTAGQQYNITLSGSATHGGGSCQLSLSYDNGKTFRVIKSIIGGCPLTPSYDFTVPSYTPNGNALLAWTWMNEIGNREFYSNCAWVDIESSVTTLPSSSKTKRHNSRLHSAKFRRTAPTSLDDHPFVYRANLVDQNSCTTTEGSDPVFPDPGPDVEYGGSMSASSTPQYQPGTCDTSGPAGATYQDLSTDNTDSTDSSNDGSFSTTIAAIVPTSTSSDDGSSTITLAPAAPSSSSTTCYSYTTSYSTYTITVSGSQTFSPMTFSPSPTSSAGSTTTIAIAPATSSPVASTSPSDAASGTFSTSNDGACGSSQMGTLKCTNGGSSFAMCNWGQWIDMGSVAAGTTCMGSDGAASIVSTDAASVPSSASSASSAPASGASIDSNATSGARDGNDSTTEAETATSAAAGGCNGASMGSMKCTNGGQGWAVCNWGSWVDMGAVAGGMLCQGVDGSAGLVAA